jgi:hypothetical protein
MILKFILFEISRIHVSLINHFLRIINHVYDRRSLCFCAGNEVQMLEAKECDPVVPDFCHTWRNIVCKLKCKIVCKSWSAHGQCLDDHACHCHCC